MNPFKAKLNIKIMTLFKTKTKNLRGTAERKLHSVNNGHHNVYLFRCSFCLGLTTLFNIYLLSKISKNIFI